MTLPVAILLSAAGASSRMRGADKLLEPVGSEALLRRVARIALATGCAVTVTLPPVDSTAYTARRAAIKGLALRLCDVPGAALGMGESLRVGAAQIPRDHAALVMLADMPEIDLPDLRALLAAYRAADGERLVRGTGADGTPGHPVIFPPDCLPLFADLAGDAGARGILTRHAPRLTQVRLPGRHALIDLDTPEDWAAWRATSRH